MSEDCIFCSLGRERIIAENDYFIVIRDAFPVTYLHTLIILKRHSASYFDLLETEILSLNELLVSQHTEIGGMDESVTGFNIGINDGIAAGQTVLHLHIHLIPRRLEDVSNPRGGVRGVIPAKQSY
jgi:ATP adenylyltransferase